MSDREVGIYELIKGVRAEIKKVKDDPEVQKDPLFNLKALELELNVVVSRAAETGIKFFVVTAGVNYKKEQVNTIKLNFEPLFVTKLKGLTRAKYKGEPIYASPLTLKKLKETVEQIEYEEE